MKTKGFVTVDNGLVSLILLSNLEEYQFNCLLKIALYLKKESVFKVYEYESEDNAIKTAKALQKELKTHSFPPLCLN